MYHVLYRKSKYHQTWPWDDYFPSKLQVEIFIASLGPDYEFRVFKEVSCKSFMPKKQENKL